MGMKFFLAVSVCIFQIASLNAEIFTVESSFNDPYQPTWESLDTRPLPTWYDEAKVGIFLHWGVYSVPSFDGEWFWADWNDSASITQFMKTNYRPGFSYQDFASEFTAEFFDPVQWAKLFKKVGAKYVVLTTKHHEGYTMWPSTYSFGWNAGEVGPHRDLLGDLTAAVRNESLRMGTYYSLYEWFNPMYNADKKSQFQKSVFVDNKMLPELVELVQNYEPDLIWADGDWEAADTYFKSTHFLAWLYNKSPVRSDVVVNDRWGIDIPCNHGDFYNCHDRFSPGVLQKHKWENAMTVDRQTWGYRRNANYEDILSSKELIDAMVITVSCGGNILINVGPTKEGTIVPIFQERLLDLGKWLGINGESIYETKPWTTQNDTMGQTWYTAKTDAVYAISLVWPSSGRILLGSAQTLFDNPETVVELLGYSNPLQWTNTGSLIIVKLPDKAETATDWAWVLKIQSPKTL